MAWTSDGFGFLGRGGGALAQHLGGDVQLGIWNPYCGHDKICDKIPLAMKKKKNNTMTKFAKRYRLLTMKSICETYTLSH